MSNSPLNLALVISELDIGGAEKNFTTLAIGLKDRGHTVQVYSIDPPAEDPQQLRFFQQLKQHQLLVNYLTDSRPNSIRLAARNLKKRLAEQNPDLLQSFLFRANLAASLACPRSSKICLGIRQAENRFVVRSIENILIQRASHTVFVSNQVAKHYHHQKDSSVIPNAQTQIGSREIENAKVNRRRFWQEKLNLEIAENDWVHLFVGRLSQQKNILQLIQTMDKVLSEFPNDHFVILGTGDLSLKARQTGTAALHAKRIHFAGWQPDPMQWLLHADVSVLMSLWEGLPNVILETMAAAIPFVSYPTHGLHDIFFPAELPEVDQQSTRAFQLQVSQASTESSFLYALRRLRNSPKEAEFLKQWNCNWVQKHFGVEKMVDAYEHLFRQLAAK